LVERALRASFPGVAGGAVDPTLLALDAGTTGVSAVLFDRELVPLASATRDFAQGFPEPGWVEHDAAAILGSVDQVLAEILDRPEARSVAALGLTNQRETVFALERGTLRALLPGIVWQDRRTAERCGELERAGRGPLVQRKTGLRLDPYFSATKIEWWLRHEPELARDARRGNVCFGTVDALVLAHLSSGRTFATDPTNASRTLLFDLERRAFDRELGELFGVDRSWLPEVRASVGDFGASDASRTGGRALPIRAVIGDQQSALFGQGCFDEGSLKITFGTGCFLLMNTGERRVDSRGGLLTTLALRRDGGSAYALEGAVFVAGALVQWLREGLGLIADADAIEPLARSVPDSAGVFIVPAFTGLGAPYWDADARGALLGLTRGTTRAHLARAALEAIAFQNAELVELLRAESGHPVEGFLADGGASRNALLLELQADLSGARVLRSADVEATARGAALAAGLAAGLYLDPGAPRAMARERQVFRPSLDEPSRRERLAAWRAAVRRVLTR
jgi:glycerol kinase